MWAAEHFLLLFSLTRQHFFHFLMSLMLMQCSDLKKAFIDTILESVKFISSECASDLHTVFPVGILWEKDLHQIIEKTNRLSWCLVIFYADCVQALAISFVLPRSSCFKSLIYLLDDHSRVVLPGEDDYINANFVKVKLPQCIMSVIS